MENRKIDKVLSDESLMPFGKYKGKEMANVPASYLIWIYDNNKCTPDVANYIEDNMDALKLEIKQQESNKKNWNAYNSK
ncbi:hypothetical protein D0T84_07905 [Dysgonomonas sp. 521]|uniref:putative quorum-sensing-regulated virulence factor n=1 Tax=Dysgonomonas sp. 521 TaxID=2302932 RepID=UPI0013CF6639|nr:DUF3820 family protein [Dysgonomonas sp. 521]NDV94841.1 hypothetical protein [Dysgonomonas sp. 521]